MKNEESIILYLNLDRPEVNQHTKPSHIICKNHISKQRTFFSSKRSLIIQFNFKTLLSKSDQEKPRRLNEQKELFSRQPVVRFTYTFMDKCEFFIA